MRLRSLSPAVVAAAGALVLAACGGEGEATGVDDSELVVYSGRAEQLARALQPAHRAQGEERDDARREHDRGEESERDPRPPGHRTDAILALATRGGAAR